MLRPIGLESVRGASSCNRVANARSENQLSKTETDSGTATATATDTARVRDAAPIQEAPHLAAAPIPPPPRPRGRHVPASVKREVFARDGGRCSYTDERGERCRETRYLELHHLQPFGLEGEHVAANLTLRCSAHNALAAEQDFGQAFIRQARRATTHESRASQEDASNI